MNIKFQQQLGSNRWDKNRCLSLLGHLVSTAFNKVYVPGTYESAYNLWNRKVIETRYATSERILSQGGIG